MSVTRLLSALFPLLLVVACDGGADPSAHTGETSTSGAPNILLIVADDMGFSDIAPFGGEIDTPALQELADNGLRLTRFYAAMTCSPTRAMLMSGTDSHLAGLGNMAETLADNQIGREGYEGHLSQRVLSLAELLKSAGYHTYMAGKWHLGTQWDQSPRARGFERSFSLLYGGGSHFDDRVGPDPLRARLLYREDGELTDQLPEDFYSTQFYTDRMIGYIEQQADDGRPFFGYLAYTAPHWPLQAPDSYLNRQRGRYDEGYDVFRQRRFDSLMAQGLLPDKASLPPRPGHIPPWDSLSAGEQRIQARDMEIYAAMVEYMDHSIGQLVDYLKRRDLYNNTFIVFMSDNGAEAWSNSRGPAPVIKYASGFDNRPENRGRKGSFVLYGPGWANVGEVPFRLHKGTTAEGGIRVPAILSGPAIENPGGVNGSVTSVMDILPTVLELAHVDHPGTAYRGKSIEAPRGKSLLPVLNGRSGAVRTDGDAIGTELWGQRSLVKGEWKLVYTTPPLGKGRWELFNVVEDVGEQHDLADAEPNVYRSMMASWHRYVAEHNVILPDGPFTIRPPEAVAK